MGMQEYWGRTGDTPTDLANAKTWRGLAGESKMDKWDRLKRLTAIAQTKTAGLPLDEACPDGDGVGTGGCYNCDFTSAEHSLALAGLDIDEYYEARVGSDLGTLLECTGGVFANEIPSDRA
jgi:hypothetical protein